MLTTRGGPQRAWLVHAAFGGSTNLLLHLPAVAHAAGLPRPDRGRLERVNRAAPRLVDALPNGPRNHPTVRVFLAGGVPEVMLHLRALGLLDRSVRDGDRRDARRRTSTGGRRASGGAACASGSATEGVDPDDVIMDADGARRRGLTGTTTVFPRRQPRARGLGHQGDGDRPVAWSMPTTSTASAGPARVFTSEAAAIAAIKGQTQPKLSPGDVLVLVGRGPLGTGMEETYQITSALKFLPWGKHVAVLTDAPLLGRLDRCLHRARRPGSARRRADRPRARRRRDRDRRSTAPASTGRVEPRRTADGPLDASAAAGGCWPRGTPHPGLAPRPDLPDDTRLWAALQEASGGTWAGAVYDVEKVAGALDAARER